MFETFTSLYQATLGSPRFWGVLAALPFFAAGFAGIVIPALPGTVLILAGVLAHALITGFAHSPLYFLVGQVVLVGLAQLVDFLASYFGVKVYGGSRAAAWGAIAGTLLIFVIGPWGIIFGPLAGAIAGELLMGQEVRQAMRSGWGTFVGFIGGVLAKFTIASIMVAWFFIQVM